MKRTIIFCTFILLANLGFAQTKTNQKVPTPANSRNDSKVINPSSIEISLAQGELILTKVFNQTNNGTPTISYTIWKSTDPKFYNANPVAIELNQASFEMVFGNSAVNLKESKLKLLKLIQEQKMNLSDEKTWIKLVKHYNNLN